MNIKDVKSQAFQLGRNFYFAGLGLTALVTDGAGNTFNSLVARGQTRVKPESEEKETTPGITARIKDLTNQAGDRIQNGVQSAIGRLGIPSRTEIKELTNSIEQLSHKIKGLQTNKA